MLQKREISELNSLIQVAQDKPLLFRPYRRLQISCSSQ